MKEQTVFRQCTDGDNKAGLRHKQGSAQGSADRAPPDPLSSIHIILHKASQGPCMFPGVDSGGITSLPKGAVALPGLHLDPGGQDRSGAAGQQSL